MTVSRGSNGRSWVELKAGRTRAVKDAGRTGQHGLDRGNDSSRIPSYIHFPHKPVPANSNNNYNISGDEMTVERILSVDAMFELDRYQLVVLLFNEMLIFTMLSNVVSLLFNVVIIYTHIYIYYFFNAYFVFNIFGIAQPQLLGCDGIVYNETNKCEQLSAHFDCQIPDLRYEFRSTTVEFGEFCPQYTLTRLDTVLALLGVTNKPRFSTTIQMVGVIFGSALSGQLSDLYGRKRVCCTNYSVGTIFIVENLPTRHRLWLSTVITWAPNYILFSLVAFLANDWRQLARACNVTTIIAIVILAFFLPESPKFLIQKKRKGEAIEALSRINNWKKEENRISHNDIVSIVQNACEKSGHVGKKKYSFLHLYSTKAFAVRTLVASFGMFSLSYVTYGLIFNLDVIKGSIFLNTAISGSLRWIVGAVVALLDHFGGKRVGRKRLHFLTVSVIMLCMAVTFLINVTEYNDKLGNVIRLSTLLAFGITGCVFLQFLLITAEMFPTGIRNIANSHINVCGRIGNVFGPMVFSIPAPILGFPYLLLTALCFTDVLLFQCFLPETKGQPLPSEMPEKKKKTVEDLELISKT
uniref:MFS domain-containing protein n=1 Tax=Heterorhabditis bacteriophora TaxID=37862 RepID=A0A1I7XJ67_HETBA